jgi:hypothetical protein
MTTSLKLDSCTTAGSGTNATWGCWGQWSSCSKDCDGPGTKDRQRVCVPGNDSIGSQNVSCTGDDQEVDLTCGGHVCPAPHCPQGYQYSIG